ncbi:uncharacterized protein ACA1_321430 [Acanthamoeba castellanii str. Neff]|uniref:DOMON domain-containing protein n=1 Tax=Acanthamoeba castellanii (strain ATCC 30010 / Neff) TaxID=1257118 RepID=L8HIC6_ACACF|nr:uncharacterized protein ACA1_321430 [Acanthamoeba castellanii str. Neff]ELR24960.1 hypothetical protein ACA1_321430 [Acanthamoeba castellanii str. Neff]
MLTAMTGTARAGAALAAVLLCCVAMTAANASIVSDVSKQFVHGSANQSYTEALIIVNNREWNGVWKLLGFDVTGASALTRFPPSFGVGGVVCHIGPTNANQPSDKWHATYSFLTATNGVVFFELDYANGRSSPMHISTRTRFENTTETFSDFNASGGKGFLFSFDYVPN